MQKSQSNNQGGRPRLDLNTKFDQYFSYYCGECQDVVSGKQLQFSTLAAMEAHCKDKEKHPQFTGQVFCCGKRLGKSNMREQMIRHLQAHTEPDAVTCFKCNKIFYNRHILRNHNITYHPAEKTDYYCEICDCSFVDDTQLQRHKNKTHVERPFQCDFCPKTFKTSSDLREHAKVTHEDAQPCICPICGKIYKSDPSLRQHIRSKHEKEKMKCPHPPCDYATVDVSCLKRHILYQHKAQFCKICEANFASPSELVKHKKEEHPDTYTCHVCGKTFKSYQSHRNHLKKVHGDLIECTKCDAKVKTRQALQFHMDSIHPEGMIIRCMDCGRTYGRILEFRNHRKRVHDGEPLLGQNYEMVPADQIVRTKRKKFNFKDPSEINMELTPSSSSDTATATVVYRVNPVEMPEKDTAPSYETMTAMDCIKPIDCTQVVHQSEEIQKPKDINVERDQEVKSSCNSLKMEISDSMESKDHVCEYCWTAFKTIPKLEKHLETIHLRPDIVHVDVLDLKIEENDIKAEDNKVEKPVCEVEPDMMDYDNVPGDGYESDTEATGNVSKSTDDDITLKPSDGDELEKDSQVNGSDEKPIKVEEEKIAPPVKRTRKSKKKDNNPEGKLFVGHKFMPGTKQLHIEYDKLFTYKCLDCFDEKEDGMNLRMGSFTEMRSHFKEKHNSPGYFFCCDKMHHIREVRGHLRQHLEPDELTCPECKRIFRNGFTLRGHIKKMHETGPETENLKKAYLRNVNCMKCKIKFNTNLELSRHRAEFHLPRVTCEICAKQVIQYRYERHLQVHNKPPDDGIKKHPCAECGKLCSSDNARRLHVMYHHRAIELAQCSLCNYTTKYRYSLTKHMAAVHSDERNFTCIICQKAFKFKHTLDRHMATHGGSRDFACEFCDATFTVNTNYYAHRMKKHPVEYAALKAAEYVKINPGN